MKKPVGNLLTGFLVLILGLSVYQNLNFFMFSTRALAFSDKDWILLVERLTVCSSSVVMLEVSSEEAALSVAISVRVVNDDLVDLVYCVG